MQVLVEIDDAAWGACLPLAMEDLAVIDRRSQEVYRPWAWGWAV